MKYVMIREWSDENVAHNFVNEAANGYPDTFDWFHYYLHGFDE